MFHVSFQCVYFTKRNSSGALSQRNPILLQPDIDAKFLPLLTICEMVRSIIFQIDNSIKSCVESIEIGVFWASIATSYNFTQHQDLKSRCNHGKDNLECWLANILNYLYYIIDVFS